MHLINFYLCQGKGSPDQVTMNTVKLKLTKELLSRREGERP